LTSYLHILLHYIEAYQLVPRPTWRTVYKRTLVPASYTELGTQGVIVSEVYPAEATGQPAW